MQTLTYLLSLFVNSALHENMALYFFLGICPLISLSTNVKTALQIGVTVTFTMIVTVIINYFIYTQVLTILDLEYLQLLFFILSIATIVQLIEAFLDTYFPNVHAIFGIFLPLLTVHCAVLGVSIFMALREYDLLSSAVFAAGSGVGWTIAIVMMAIIRQRIDMKSVPQSLGKTGITMIIATIMAVLFCGISEIFKSGAL